MTNYFENTTTPQYSEFIHKSRYARWLDDEGRREHWPETVDRYLGFFKERFPHLSEEIDSLRPYILELKVMPSMRCMMTAGKALARDEVAGYNCSYVAVDHPRVFDEVMYVLMCGTGVGFSVERQYINKLPEIAEEFHDTDTVIVVRDSKIGWATAFRELIGLLYLGQVPKWDVSRVRPAGSRLKTFGGRASGPEPLVSLFDFTVNLFKRAAGRKLTSIECHDLMCKIADTIVVGGVRRSALISLTNLSDDRMRDAKTGQYWETNPQRELANISASYTERPDFTVFMKEMMALHQSKRGERGIFSRQAAKKQAARNGRRDASYDFGTNPCCVPGDVPILTDKGYYPIAQLLGQRVNVWNGCEWSSVLVRDTGVQPLVRVDLSDGTSLTCTPNHKFVLHDGYINKREGTKRIRVPRLRKEVAESLVAGDVIAKFDMPVVDLPAASYEAAIDPYSQGFYTGDGNTDLEWSYIYPAKYASIDRLRGEIQEEVSGRRRWIHGQLESKTFVPINSSINFAIEWLAGLLDADGTVVRDNGFALQLSSVDKEFLLNVRLMLTRLGVRAKLNSMAEAGIREMPDGRGGSAEYECRATWRLCINQADTAKLQSLGLKLSRIDLPEFTPQRDARRFVTVTGVVDLGRDEQTYCFTEPLRNQGTFGGIVTGQSEILLRSAQFCNLSEVVARPDDTFETLLEKVRVATIFGTLQATLTNFRYLRKIWQKNTEEERLLGVSITGIMDHPVLSDSDNPELPKWLAALKQCAIDTNVEWADKLGIPASTAITCVKPSGTVSQLVDCSSGIHPRYSKYYIRTVRASANDPIAKMLEAEGFPAEVDVTNPLNRVFSFPIKAPDNTVIAREVGAIEQLKLWKIYQDHWCEHKPSITVYYTDDEFLGMMQWVWDNFDDISGISFLPHSDHAYKQAPYQEIDKETYEVLAAQLPDIDWSRLSEFEIEDTTENTKELACSAGGFCEIVDLV